MKWRFTAARHDPLAGARGSVDNAFGAVDKMTNSASIEAEETTAQGLSAKAKPKGMGVENRVAAIRDGGWMDLKMISQIGKSRSVAS